MNKKITGGKRTSYHVLGVPTFASAREIRSAYLKRVEVLSAYRFDKAKQPMEWQVVVDVLRELNDAYVQLSLPFPQKDQEATVVPAPGAPKFEKAMAA
jgi:curved DNA-binding protein CbpA